MAHITLWLSLSNANNASTVRRSMDECALDNGNIDGRRLVDRERNVRQCERRSVGRADSSSVDTDPSEKGHRPVEPVQSTRTEMETAGRFHHKSPKKRSMLIVCQIRVWPSFSTYYCDDSFLGFHLFGFRRSDCVGGRNSSAVCRRRQRNRVEGFQSSRAQPVQSANLLDDGSQPDKRLLSTASLFRSSKPLVCLFLGRLIQTAYNRQFNSTDSSLSFLLSVERKRKREKSVIQNNTSTRPGRQRFTRPV